MADDSKKTLFRKIVVPTDDAKKKFLVGKTPPFVGKPVELSIRPDKGNFTIGRIEGHDFQIPFETVSSNHCKITIDGDTFLIEDTNSSNGTFINNNPLEPGKAYPLNHANVVKFDCYEFIFIDSAREDLMETLKLHEKPGALVIGLYSPKGGTGLSSVAVNLAYSLAEMSKKKVAIADFNFSFGDILTYSLGKIGPSVFNLIQEPNIHGEMIAKYLTKGQGYDYLAAPAKAEDAERVNNWGKENPMLIRKAIWALKSQFDFVILDMKNDLDDVTLTAWEDSNIIYLTGSPEIGHMLALRKVLDVMDKLHYDDKKVKVLINRMGRENTLGGEEIKKFLKRDFVSLPHSPTDAILTSHMGQLYVKEQPTCALSQSVQNLARSIRGEEVQAVEGGGLFSKLKNILGF
jgi:MinD-like ATPase involved in chromosome partitioning or flagellar assembly